MMNGILERIRNTIVEVALKEDQTLRRLCRKGIFFMPERTFAYEVGKAIAADANRIFGTADFDWEVEKILGAGGPTDLVLRPADRKAIAVEFKKYGYVEQSIKDISKLARLGESYDKLFCNLIHSALGRQLDDPCVQSIIAGTQSEQLQLIPLTDQAGHGCNSHTDIYFHRPLMDIFALFTNSCRIFWGNLSHSRLFVLLHMIRT
jgi:hypothetical protein